MEKINYVSYNYVATKEKENDNNGFSSTLTEIPQELITMDQRNPFRETNDNQIAEDKIRAATLLLFMLKSALVAALTAAAGSRSSLRNKN